MAIAGSGASGKSGLDVLIAGAGPTGLVLALWLVKMGARVRIFDKTTQPGTTSRALAVQGRTLELYSQTNLAEALIENGRTVDTVNLWVRGKRAARVVIGKVGENLSPFPDPLIYPQDEHERLLIDRLAAADVEVERETELVGFEDSAAGVRARLKKKDGREVECHAAYLAGCDGAHSSVREALGIGFPGGDYSHLFYVADVDAAGPVANGEIHVALDRADFLAVFPLKGEGRLRLVGTMRDDIAKGSRRGEELRWEDVRRQVIRWMCIQVRQVNWFSTYWVHHRVAEHFGKGRAFLLGDAAHIHSPVGGQGMNTGIGDAVNLAWKLAAVTGGRAQAELLDSYEQERIAFARRLVATTDKAFTGVTSPNPLARLLRLEVAPALLGPLFSIQAVRRAMYRAVSQTGVNYRGSRLSEGRAGKVHGGDRLPWVKNAGSGGDNFVPLRSLEWQVHVYGEAAGEIRRWCEERNLELHVFRWREEIGRAGLERDAVYLVRPDGYVGLAYGNGGGAEPLQRYLETRGIAAAGRSGKAE